MFDIELDPHATILVETDTKQAVSRLFFAKAIVNSGINQASFI
ncbi:hypothetical protein EV05_1865 [Prochlorococcus sp. MIT 0601]|nr:hypothetical protein EV05_1865 [Prochlorococcus sp. MIT 0601]